MNANTEVECALSRSFCKLTAFRQFGEALPMLFLLRRKGITTKRKKKERKKKEEINKKDSPQLLVLPEVREAAPRQSLSQQPHCVTFIAENIGSGV